MSSTRTPFCPVCKKAGKPESEYTSHFVKDKPGNDGVVVCPHLLGQKCGYCKKLGHTPKFCPKLKERDGRKKTQRVSNYRSPQATYEMSANQRRQVEREAEVLNRQKLKLRERRIETILYEKHYWFDPLRREEEIKKCLFAQTLFRLSDEQLAGAHGWVDGEERFSATFHTWYNHADEKNAMEEADWEFKYLDNPLTRPKLKRRTAEKVSELWMEVPGCPYDAWDH